MKRTWFGLLVVAFSLAIVGQAHAAPSQISKVMGNLRWGMSELDVKNALKGKVSGVSATSFDGKRASTDGTVVGEEYTHGNEESMLSYKDKDAENYLFFVGGDLWKWVKVYPASKFRSDFAATVKKKFGKGYDKTGEVNAGSGASYSYVEFVDRNTRLRAVDKASDYRVYVLMFESLDTARSITALRSNTIRRGTPAKKSTAVAKKRVVDDEQDEAPVASRRGGSTAAPGALASNGKQKKSLFADEKRGETDEEYEARKEKMRNDEREAQRRQHEKKEDSKKAKILDELAGIDDEDPLSGMGK
jgi:hypothetical protein